MMQNKVNTPVFITGIERSGSSLIGRIINMCGAFSGKVTSMCENVNLKALTDEYYKGVGIDTRGQYPLPNTNEMLIPGNWNQEVTELLYKEGYRTSELWMYKSSRIAQIWPVWNHAFPKATWIIVRRRSADVIDSCLKTGFMNAYSDKQIQRIIGVTSEKEGWLWWIHQQENTFREMIDSGLEVIEIWPERMLDGNFDQIHYLLTKLDLQWNPGIISLLNYTLIKDKKK